MPRRELVGEAWIGSRQKRALDLAYATALAPVILPVGAVTMGMAYVAEGQGGLRKVQRVGHGGRPFDVIKLRTASADLGSTSEAGPERLSSLSRYIGQAGLDETAQIVNILDGTMSVWGPRPASASFMEAVEGEVAAPLYREWLEKRCLSKPGGLSSYALAFHLRELPTAQRKLAMVKMDIIDFDNASRAYDRRLLLTAVKKSVKLFRGH